MTRTWASRRRKSIPINNFCLSRLFEISCVQIIEKPEPRWDRLGKTKNRTRYQNRKTASIFTKTENQMLKTQKTEIFCNKNRKTDLKNSQNRKTEIPNAPLLTTPRNCLQLLASRDSSLHMRSTALLRLEETPSLQVYRSVT